MGYEVHDFGNEETRARLGGPGRWANVGISFGDESHRSLQRQKQGGVVMLLSGIIGNRLVSTVIVPEVLKVIAAA